MRRLFFAPGARHAPQSGRRILRTAEPEGLPLSDNHLTERGPPGTVKSLKRPSPDRPSRMRRGAASGGQPRGASDAHAAGTSRPPSSFQARPCILGGADERAGRATLLHPGINVAPAQTPCHEKISLSFPEIRAAKNAPSFKVCARKTTPHAPTPAPRGSDALFQTRILFEDKFTARRQCVPQEQAVPSPASSRKPPCLEGRVPGECGPFQDFARTCSEKPCPSGIRTQFREKTAPRCPKAGGRDIAAPLPADRKTTCPAHAFAFRRREGSALRPPRFSCAPRFARGEPACRTSAFSAEQTPRATTPT